jgi:hypothetical protein
MGSHLAFTRLVHSDWSIDPRKRWTAMAVRTKPGWHVEPVEQTPPAADFLNFLFDRNYITLAGFDFAIGLPSFFIDRIKFAFSEEFDFRNLLTALSTERWRDFFVVAENANEIALTRPFYPHRSIGGVKRQHLIDALGCATFAQLLRSCDKATARRGAASPLFWTLGPKQVGKAALSGWQEILVPARGREAYFWPFDGALEPSARHILTIAETYPAESYRHVGINLRSGMSKRRQIDRTKALAGMRDWCAANRIILSSGAESQVAGGFGREEAGEDPFDAFAGLIAMIEVADGRRMAAPDSNVSIQKREGWILGQTELPVQPERSPRLDGTEPPALWLG